MLQQMHWNWWRSIKNWGSRSNAASPCSGIRLSAAIRQPLPGFATAGRVSSFPLQSGLCSAVVFYSPVVKHWRVLQTPPGFPLQFVNRCRVCNRRQGFLISASIRAMLSSCILFTSCQTLAGFANAARFSAAIRQPLPGSVTAGRVSSTVQ